MNTLIQNCKRVDFSPGLTASILFTNAHISFFTAGFKTSVPEHCADDIYNICMSHFLNEGSAHKVPMFNGELLTLIGTLEQEVP